MREHRFDPFTGDGVVLCDERVPDRALPVPPDGPVPCASCAGNEAFTGRTLAAVPPEGAWSARAVAHHLPALRVEESGDTHSDGAYLKASGLGAHEVLIESPIHAPLHQQPVERSVAALQLLGRRLADLRQDRRLVTFAWWREEGMSTCHHPRAQLVGLPYVPEAVARSASHQLAWAGRHGRALQREVVAAEEADGRRLVWSGPLAVAVCPWAPRASFEVWVLPRFVAGPPADASDEVWADVAAGVWAARRAQARVLGDVPVVTSLAAGPVDAVPAVGWFVRVRPRTVPANGFEEASGAVMVGVYPEESASLLRSALSSADAAVP